MKAKVLIISLLVLSLLAAFKLKAQISVHPGNGEGWVATTTHPDTTKILIADETILKINKTEAKITTTLESVFQDISLKFGTRFKKIMITYKQVNGYHYKEYVITIPIEVANNIKKWSKNNL